MKKLLIVLTVTFVVLFSGCGHKKDVVKIGVVAPLTGAASAASKYCVDGFEMAIEELNSKEDGPQYEIVYEDCQSDPTLASNCYKRLELQGAKYVVGLGGQFALAVAPMTKGKDMLYFTTADYNEAVLKMTDCGFRVFPSATTVARVSADFLADTLHVTKVATITMNTVPCLMSTEQFVKDIRDKNMEVVYQDKYDIGCADFKNTIAKMAETGVEAVFFNGFGISPAAFCSQMTQYPQFDNLIVMGDVNFSTKSFIENNKNDKLRIYYADYEMEGVAAESYYSKNHNRPNSYVGCCYMLPYLINEAYTKVSDKKDFKAQMGVLRSKTISTPAGEITFDAAGSADMGMKVFELK